jgi:prolyl-tRNA editing enzyme YbaK/EbsC (Cys-tRNA(Pro) deacylase)
VAGGAAGIKAEVDVVADTLECVERVREALSAAGSTAQIVSFPAGTASSADAAAAIGCSLAQIAKSVVFRSDDGPVVVIASGVNRVDRAKAAATLGQPLKSASPDWVQAHTGFAVGGVAPIGHPRPVPVLIDKDLAQHSVVWAAAGSPCHVFGTSAAELADLTGGLLADVRQD